MNYPFYRVAPVMRIVHEGIPFNTGNDFMSENEAHRYLAEHTSHIQRVIMEIISENESYLVYLEDKK